MHFCNLSYYLFHNLFFSLPFTYATISKEDYDKALKHTETKDERVASSFRRFAEWVDGEAQIVELASRMHEITSSTFVHCFLGKEGHKGVPWNNSPIDLRNLSS